MASYFMFFRYTQQGLEHIQESPARIDVIKQQFKKANAEVKAFYGLMGQYDTLFLVEAPDDETVGKLSLQIGKAGNVTCESHRAFTEEEWRRMVRPG